MEFNPETQQRKGFLNRNRKLLASGLLGVALGALVGYGALALTAPEKFIPQEQQEEVASSTQFARSAPVHLRIPAVDIEADFEAPLGLNEDQTVEVPDSFWKVGWYKHGATPGEIGPSVVLGHVDSWEGPAIFWPLRQLTPGDRVEIERADGTTAIFEVEALEQYSQDDFPTELVYGPIDFAGLRLVTCTGTYDHGTQKYSHNLVVYARLVTEPSS